MKIRSYGKINIFLNILGKREDGYHDIETIIQRVDLFDDIEINVDKDVDFISIEIHCDNEEIPTDNRNLCYKACMWFMERYNLKGRVTININKNIPACAGLGGGTSNGAEVIKALNNIYGLNVPIESLCKESVILGADFPYCIMGGTVLCEGIGEKIIKLNSFKDKIILIVKPNFGFITKDIYENFHLDNVVCSTSKDKMINAIEENDFYKACSFISNTLEYSNVAYMEIIRHIKESLIHNGAISSSMSGSGSSVYGVFDNLYLAQRCYDIFKSEFKEVFLTKTIDD